MKYPKTLYLSCLLAIAATLTLGTAVADQPGSDHCSSGAEERVKCGEATLSQDYSQSELDAFFDSEYSYWDAAQLANYWGQALDEAKARMGRKILWGPADVAILEQFLLDARIESLAYIDELRFYSETSYTYDDAAALANFWGDASPYDAKLRIERNLIMGNADAVETALQLATQQP